jgi:cytochrome c oxidase cbb3-type subunit 3
VYILGAHVFDFIPSYEEDLAASQEELSALRGAFESVNQPFEVTAETMAAYIGVQDQIDAGAATYATSCMMCHGDKGQGLIGPNLTDQYWIHGGTDADLFNVITSGVPVKGMTPWGNILSQEQRAQVVSYIRSLEGSNPSGGKGPEGELFGKD